MLIEQLYTQCLSEAAYYIESDGEAAIIDPLREIDFYIDKAKQRGVVIKYVFETHFHADFVSGHIDLARQTGAKIIFGPNANPAYEAHNGFDGEVFDLGSISLTLLHTPGHTLESSCYLLKDKTGEPHSLFTGDTLFVGDVGRPDLAVMSNEMTKEDLAGMLYDSIRTKIMTLPDGVIVYPAHGKGSSCGKNLGSETYSTIGEQKETNYALQNMTKDDFINEVTDGLLAPPHYFSQDVFMNKNGYDPISSVLDRNFRALSPDEFKSVIQTGGFILDTRDPNVFATSHIKNSINIGLNGRFAPWVGTVIPLDSRIIFISTDNKEKEVILRLARVGYENVLGFLDGGLEAWEDSLDHINNVPPSSAVEIIAQKTHVILDVRAYSEVESGSVKEAIHIPLTELSDRLNELHQHDQIAIYCAGGYRSMIAASILKTADFKNITNIQGGFNQLRNLEIEMA